MNDNTHTVNVPFLDYVEMKKAYESLKERQEIIDAHFELINHELGLGMGYIDLTRMPKALNHSHNHAEHGARNGKLFYRYEQ